MVGKPPSKFAQVPWPHTQKVPKISGTPFLDINLGSMLKVDDKIKTFSAEILFGVLNFILSSIVSKTSR
jgi:hypothetical protein